MLRCTPQVQDILAPGSRATTPKALAALVPSHAPEKHAGCGCGGAAKLSPAMLLALGALAGAVVILAVRA